MPNESPFAPVRHPAVPEHVLTGAGVNIAHEILRGTVTGVLRHVFAGLMKARSTGVELHVVRDPATMATQAQGVLRLAVPFGLEVTDEALLSRDFQAIVETEAKQLAEAIIREIRRELAVGEDELPGARPAPGVLGEFPPEIPAPAAAPDDIPPMPFEKE